MKKILVLAGCAAVLGANAENSPYLYKVYDFLPAPGQFINTLPEYEEGDTQAEINAKVEEQLCGDKTPGMISLGSYGGYVVVGFDHPVVNVKGEYDFKIYGNSFRAAQAENGGSSEPGIVMVSVDTNGDGIPNDKWYELAGSDYAKSLKNYQITYYRPDENKEKVKDPNDNTISDATYIRWTSNNPDAEEGYVYRNNFHSQSYWPSWYEGDTMTFTGTLLDKNGEDISGYGSYWVLYFFDWGYVDNMPNSEDPGLKIDWAVDENGNPVELDKIDFIKIYCAENQYCGWLGETSTEVSGGEDLHPSAVAAVKDMETDSNAPVEIYNLNGVRIDNENIPAGVYIRRQGNKVSKFLVN
jgi:hypothetical protein